ARSLFSSAAGSSNCSGLVRTLMLQPVYGPAPRTDLLFHRICYYASASTLDRHSGKAGEVLISQRKIPTWSWGKPHDVSRSGADADFGAKNISASLPRRPRFWRRCVRMGQSLGLRHGSIVLAAKMIVCSPDRRDSQGRGYQTTPIGKTLGDLPADHRVVEGRC